MTEKHVVVFDDDEDLLDIFKFLFEDKGWHVTSFSDCAQVIDRVRDNRPDLILMDNWIPPAGGVAATQSLKSELDLKHIPIILLSANNDVQDLASKAGSDAYLPKPFQFAKLQQMAEELVFKNS